MLFHAKGKLLPAHLQPTKYLHKWPALGPPTSGKLAPTRSSKGSPPSLAPTPAKKTKHSKSLGVKKHAMKTAPRKDKTVPKAAAAAKAKAKAGATANAGSTAKAGTKAKGKGKSKTKAAPLKKDLKTVPPHTGRGESADPAAHRICYVCKCTITANMYTFTHQARRDRVRHAHCRDIRLGNEARSLPLRIGITFPCGIRCGMAEISCGVPSPMRG